MKADCQHGGSYITITYVSRLQAHHITSHHIITFLYQVIPISKGEKKKEKEIKEENYYRAERFYGSFYRTIPLSTAVETDKVDASYKDGVLTLKIPKKEEAKPKQTTIDVK